jgi:hypothetical protein
LYEYVKNGLGDKSRLVIIKVTKGIVHGYPSADPTTNPKYYFHSGDMLCISEIVKSKSSSSYYGRVAQAYTGENDDGTYYNLIKNYDQNNIYVSLSSKNLDSIS